MQPRKGLFASLWILPFLAAQILFAPGPRLEGGRLFQTTKEPQVSIDAPRPGEALQGVVAVNGNTQITGFQSAEVDFAYQNNSAGTWFVLQQSSTPVAGGTLASWDTTTIGDGIYRLRVQVILQDGTVKESIVEGVRVRNYLPVETSTPAVKPAGVPTETPTPTPLGDYQVKIVQVTALPTNPAQLTPENLQNSALQGAALVVGALFIAGVYIGIKMLVKR